MAPQWMPQNLQKRLLLFILQQLSLFSEIDPDNLDVSLGSSTQVRLSDIEIDTDALKIPGIYLRNGRLRNLLLQLNVNGGVNIDVDGFSITIALASGSSSTSALSMTKSSLGGILDDKSKFSLAQSTMELANSIMQDDDDFKTPNQSINLDGLDEVPTNENQETRRQSTFNSVMQKAVEVALSKLNVNIRNVSVRILMDHATIDLEIDEATFINKDNKRTIDLSDIKVLGVHPGADPGEKPEVKVSAVNDESAPIPGHEVEGETNSESESDNDDDLDNNEMMDSSVLEKKDLNESLMYSKEEASTIYMSAASNAFEARQQEQLDSSHLMHINKAQITFEGLSEVEDLKIDVDRIKIAATPLPLTLLHIIESLGILSNQSINKRYSNISAKLRDQRSQKKSSESLFFNSLRAKHVEINFVSALLPNNEFAKPDTLRLLAKNFEFIQKNPELSYGSLKTVVLYDGKDKIGCFQGDETKNDIRFEKKSKENEFTLLLPKNFEAHFTPYHLQIALKLSSLSSQISDSLKKLTPSSTSPPQTKSSILIQTSHITISFKVSEIAIVEIKVAPISYDSDNGSLSISSVTVSSIEDRKRTQLISVLKTALKNHSSERQFRTYDNNGCETVLVAPVTLSINSVEITHSLSQLKSLSTAFSDLVKSLVISQDNVYFKTRKKARIFSKPFLQSRKAVKLLIELNTLKFLVTDIHPRFGDIKAQFFDVSFLLHKENINQLHILSGSVSRIFEKNKEPVFDVIYPDDKSAPILSVRTKDFKEINIYLRNVTLDYYTKWLSLFDDGGKQSYLSDSEVQSSPEISSPESKLDLKFKLVDFGVGLNPGCLSSKAILVISSGNFDVSLSETINMKAEFRAPELVLIDDSLNILSIDEAKRNRNVRNSWSLVSFYNSRGFASVAKSKTVSLGITINQMIDDGGVFSKSIGIDVLSELLELELCADSSQCLLQLFNDLKQPVVMNLESRYKVQSQDIDVFGDVEQCAFNGNSLLEAQKSHISGSEPGSNNEPLNIVDGYYDEAQPEGADILDKDLSELTVSESNIGNTAFYTGENLAPAESNSNNSDSLILFNDVYFENNLSNSEIQQRPRSYPFSLKLNICKVSISIFDGYDWNYTRKAIGKAVKNLEQKVSDQQRDRNEFTRTSSPRPKIADTSENIVFGETLFDSIHVSLPVHAENPSVLTDKINKNLQNVSSDTIEFGKNNIKKLKLRRTKYHKVLIELDDLDVNFTLFNDNDPVDIDAVEATGAYDVINETVVRIKDFEVTDNVSTSTWNKFVTILKEFDRENDTSMLNLKITTIRPVQFLAATEIIMNVEVLPLRLHVDQDTLEVLIRFAEFRDSRFSLVDKFEDVMYIQKFTINAIRIKLDYKPKKIDYSGLRSGHTTELMNLFILDEAAMVLKQVTLYGISGFPRLGMLLNGLWMPDIKQTQLSGVLSGLAPVRSIVKIGSGFKDLFVVPVNEYKKDGRFYRSVSKGVQQFTKSTTNELLKFGIKIANGTQTLLEYTEESLGGAGSSARLPVDLMQQRIDEANEPDSNSDEYNYDCDSYGTANAYGASSQLIGRSSLRSHPLYCSTYQPTLESIADINQEATGLDLKRMRSRFVEIPAVSDYYIPEQLNLDNDDQTPKIISLYANQPTSLKEGLLLAYDSLGKNFFVAKDAIINAGCEISESGSAQETTKALLKATPVTLIRPMIGATEATSRALFGLNNQLDSSQRKYTEDKYKQFKKK